jgi:hypothetical protein
LEVELKIAQPPTSDLAAKSRDTSVESELPTASFVLPSPLPDKPVPPAPPPVAREISLAQKRPVPIASPEPAASLGIERDELESLPPVKRTRARGWAAIGVALFALAVTGATAIYSGVIKLPFEMGSLFGSRPKVVLRNVSPEAQPPPKALATPAQEPSVLASDKAPSAPEVRDVVPSVPAQPSAQEIVQKEQPAAEPKAAAEPAPPLPEKSPQTAPSAQVAAQPTPNAAAAQGPFDQKPSQVEDQPSAVSGAKDIRSAIARGEQLFKKGEIAEAEAVLREVLAKDSDEHHAMEVLIRVLLKRGRAAEALPYVKRIVEKRSRRAPYRLLYGDVLEATGDHGGAQAQWQEALILEPDNAAAKRRLGSSD